MTGNFPPGQESGLGPHAPYQWPIPIPDRPSDQAPRVGFCFNVMWAAAITGALETLLNADTWDGQPASQAWAVEQILRVLAELQTCEEDMDEQCCTDILEKLDIIIGLLGGGPTSGSWPTIRIDLENLVIAGSYTDIHPLIPDTYWYVDSGDENGEAEVRQIAGCRALWDLYAAMVFSFYNQVLKKAVEVPLDITYTLGPLIGGLAFIAGGLTVGAVETLLADSAAVENLICCIPDNLVGEAISQDSLIAAIRTCEVGGNETLLGELMVWHVANPANFGLFLKQYGDEIATGFTMGEDYTCPCGEEEGISCEGSGSFSQYEYPYNGGSGWTPDSVGSACSGFGHILNSGGTFNQTADRCINFAQLNRFYGGTASNEAVIARFTINGMSKDVAILYGQHVTCTWDPPQYIGPDHDLRIDLIGGGELMCYTGFIAKMAPEA